jgi:hypothetical protein
LKKFLWIRYRPGCPEYDYFEPRFPYTDCPDAVAIPRPPPPPPPPPPLYVTRVMAVQPNPVMSNVTSTQQTGSLRLSREEIQNLMKFMLNLNKAGVNLEDVKKFKDSQGKVKEKFKFISKEEK